MSEHPQAWEWHPQKSQFAASRNMRRVRDETLQAVVIYLNGYLQGPLSVNAAVDGRSKGEEDQINPTRLLWLRST